jgi:glucan 1,3-beta-glucosidase
MHRTGYKRIYGRDFFFKEFLFFVCFTASVTATLTSARNTNRDEHISEDTYTTLNCSWWYEETFHGSLPNNGNAVFINARRDAGAVGDGITDDTDALLYALNANQTGLDGSNLAKSARIVYLPAGTYLIRDTLVLYFWTNLIGNPRNGCTSTILLAPNSSGYSDKTGLLMKPILAANGGFNLTGPKFWIVDRERGGHANDLFYTSIRDIKIVVSQGNDGAVGIYWPVAQQTSVRNVNIDLTESGAIGFDMAGDGYNVTYSAGGPSIGGGGQIDSLTVQGGRIGLRLSGSQWTYTNIDLSNHSLSCVYSNSLIWSHTFIRLRTMNCPAALTLLHSIGSISLIDTRLGPYLGTSAIITDGSSVYLQNVILDVYQQETNYVIDQEIVIPEVCCLVISSWTRGPLFINGIRSDLNASGIGKDIPLPSKLAINVDLSCKNPATGILNICGGSLEDPDSGIALIYRPSFVDFQVDNVITDFNAIGDGIHDDTDAISAAISRPNSVTFFPFGTFAVRAGELVIGCNASIIGEALSTIALFPNSAPMINPNGDYYAMLSTPDDPTCSATLIDLSLSTLGIGNEGAMFLNHVSGGSNSYIGDVTARIIYKIGLKARFGKVETFAHSGSAQLSNVWLWGMDHNLTDLVEMSCSDPSCIDHKPVGQELGVSIASTGPLFLLGTNFEHSSLQEYMFEEGAANIISSVIQTEGSLVSLNISKANGPIVIFGGLFGSGSGHNATFYATRRINSSCFGNIDYSYRAVSVMQKQPINYTLVDNTNDEGGGFSCTSPISSTGWELSAFVNSC